MSDQLPLVMRNAFNNETFVFSGADNAQAARFDVVLGAGGSGGGNALVHVHPEASETFLVKSGCLAVTMRGVEHIVEAGSCITVPAGTPHCFRNAHDGDTEATVVLAPAQQHLRFFKNFAALTEKRAEWFSASGDPKMLLIALVLHSYRDHLYLAGAPIILQKLLFATLAPLARLRGYRLEVVPVAEEVRI